MTLTYLWIVRIRRDHTWNVPVNKSTGPLEVSILTTANWIMKAAEFKMGALARQVIEPIFSQGKGGGMLFFLLRLRPKYA